MKTIHWASHPTSRGYGHYMKNGEPVTTSWRCFCAFEGSVFWKHPQDEGLLWTQWHYLCPEDEIVITETKDGQ